MMRSAGLRITGANRGMTKKTEKLIQQAQSAYAQGHRDQARLCYEKILAKEPRHLDARYLLGTLLAEQGLLAQAQPHLEKAAQQAPNSPFIQNNLGNLYMMSGQDALAEKAYQQALKSSPGMAEALANLGNLLLKRGALGEAINAGERALQGHPGMFAAWVLLGNACREQGRTEQALAHYRQALALQPSNAATRSNLLMVYNYHPTASTAEILDAHREWGKSLGPATPRAARHTDRLRIAYVSPDLARHPVGYLLELVLAHHDRQGFEIRVYSDTPNEDDVTARLKGHCEHWRSIAGKDDDSVTAILRADNIDIAVDLAGHTAGNRLGVFARRVAPVQVSYLGYCTTTGVPTMDYAISDRGFDPADTDVAQYTETLWRLPRPSFAFVPDDDFPAVSSLPAIAAGRLAFGSFNTLAKLNDRVLDLWAAVLCAVPDSGFLMQAGALTDDRTREDVLNGLVKRGVDEGRVMMIGFTSLQEHLALFQHIDISLDTFPWNGHMTTLNSLWMGVPVLTLEGDRRASRMGAAILREIGLDDFVARDADEFVARAVALDRDRDRLASLRGTLRQRLSASALADGVGLARALEDAFTAMHAKALGDVATGTAK